MMQNGTDAPVGVLDSGVGGIAVLKHASRRLPNEDFIFYGDIGNAPYGEKTTREIVTLTMNGAEILAVRGIKALVVACNTATAAAVKSLRQSFAFPVIGMEPAVKPACEELHGQTVAVMATEATLKLGKFRALAGKYVHTNTILPLPCRGLSRLVETAGPGSPEIMAYLRQLFAGMDKPPAGIVIGCTHYSFLSEDIRKILPRALIFDGADGTARHLEQALKQNGLLTPNPDPGKIKFMATPGWENEIPLFEAFYQMKLEETDRPYA